MFARLSGNSRIAYSGHRVVQMCAALLVPARHGMAVGRNPTEAGGHPLHRLLIEREEVVAPVVLDLGATKRDSTGRDKMGADLAWVHRVVEYRGTDEDGGSVAVAAGGLLGVGCARKGRGGLEGDAIARGRRRSRWGVGRRRGRVALAFAVRVFGVGPLHR